MKDKDKHTYDPGENVAALLSALKQESVAHELVRIANAAEAGKRLDAVKEALQARVVAQSKVLEICQK
jgi:hypothetical protein